MILAAGFVISLFVARAGAVVGALSAVPVFYPLTFFLLRGPSLPAYFLDFFILMRNFSIRARLLAFVPGRTEVAVKKRLQVIFQKLGAVDRAHAVAEAIRRGLI